MMPGTAMVLKDVEMLRKLVMLNSSEQIDVFWADFMVLGTPQVRSST